MGDYEADMVAEDQIVLELKAVSAFHPAHEAKAHHYLAAIPLRYATGTFGWTAPGYPDQLRC
jgi:GxxExxY protein